MKLSLLVIAFLVLNGLVRAQDDFSLCKKNSLLPPDDFDKDFICFDVANSTGIVSVDGPVIVTIPAAVSRSLTPPENESLILTFSATDLFGQLDGSQGNITSFNFKISGGAVGLTSAAEISYDFEGDGNWDRIELFDIFATNPIASDFESWSSSVNATQNITGEWKNLVGGSIRLRVWSAFGGSPMFLKIGLQSNATQVSWISFPYNFNGSCCFQIELLQQELSDIQERVDILSSRLLNSSRNCCSGTGTSGSSGASTGTVADTVTEIVSSSAIVTSTTTETATSA